ncbi:hypothetical protein AB0N79_14770 [Streptomyces microflavus]|nr:hypothetical protein [Streptomyces microflavus]MCX4654304.1 hypothetical protein [Streptomyces microflavus]
MEERLPRRGEGGARRPWKVSNITVDKPVVTNWHTAPTDAVPFG